MGCQHKAAELAMPNPRDILHNTKSQGLPAAPSVDRSCKQLARRPPAPSGRAPSLPEPEGEAGSPPPTAAARGTISLEAAEVVVEAPLDLDVGRRGGGLGPSWSRLLGAEESIPTNTT
uniref:Uncharacterized protein n=1 Tax=Triticum urartu TaxID=4572 RepID=A0A8R7PVU3_TRIUA